MTGVGNSNREHLVPARQIPQKFYLNQRIVAARQRDPPHLRQLEASDWCLKHRLASLLVGEFNKGKLQWSHHFGVAPSTGETCN